MASQRTKKFRAGKWIFWSLSFLCNWGFIIAFFIYGLVCGQATARYSVAITGIVAIILGIISILFKRHWRTPLIIILGGLYFAIMKFSIVIITLAVCIILDELIFTPLYLYFREKTSINKEIDKRGL